MKRKLAALLVLLGLATATQAAFARARKTVRVAAVGHIVIGTDFPKQMQFLPPDDGAGLIDHVAPLLRDADLSLANLAAPLSTRGTVKRFVDGVRRFAFRTPPRYAGVLETLGLDTVLAANNHILDFGPDAYDDTLALLDRLHVEHVGLVDQVSRSKVNGVRVAIVGFTQPYRPDFQSHHDLDLAAAVVARAAADCDVLIALVHGGSEGKDQIHLRGGKEYAGAEYRGRPVELAHRLVEAGADLVIGFGAHAPRAMEWYEGRLIAYSLGNFLTYGPFDLHAPNYLSAVLQVTLDKRGELVDGQVVPLRLIFPGVPSFDPKGRAVSFIRRMSKADFPGSPLTLLPDGTIRVQTADPKLVVR